MKILAVDVGTGTQDVLLFDSRIDVENSFKMVLPSPTMIVHRKIKAATKKGMPVVLTGVTMGGGPSHWAVEGHLEAGYPVFATPDAARTFNDDLDFVQESGVRIIGEDEVKNLAGKSVQVEMGDFNFSALEQAFSLFGISLSDLDAVAIAVFDHGAAPPGYSDRQFRFDYIAERVEINRELSTFAFFEEDIPELMTRMRAVALSASNVPAPLVLMDTAPAAVLGAAQDYEVRKKENSIIVNVGNFHTISFRMANERIEGVFEHHTGMLDTHKLDGLMYKLADGSLQHSEIFEDGGHGALLLTDEAIALGAGNGVVVTGPRRVMLNGSQYSPYFATPYGDMMQAGCFGLVKAVGGLFPDDKEEIDFALEVGQERPPWELT